MADEALQDFAATYGYELTELGDERQRLEDAPAPRTRRTPDDEMLAAWEWGRSVQADVEETLRRWPKRLSTSSFREFVRRIAAYKQSHGLLDFADLLERALAEGLRPDVDVLIVDEGQDLSPLQARLAEQWMVGCRRVIVAGDDDQAIYDFAGGSPEWLHELASTWPFQVLEQSHRIPRAVFSIASQVIARNRNRVIKTYRPRDVDGKVAWRSLRDAVRATDNAASALVLARNRKFLAPAAGELLDRRVPFLVEGRGATSPLSNAKLCAAVRAAVGLRQGCEIDDHDLESLLDILRRDGNPEVAAAPEYRASFLGTTVSSWELRERLGLGRLLEALQAKGPAGLFRGSHEAAAAYLCDLIARHGSLPEPRVRLTSIHAAKGREADVVVVLPDVTIAVDRAMRDGRNGGYESENRVFYVAVSRARQTLVLVQPGTRRSYAIPTVKLPGILARPAPAGDAGQSTKRTRADKEGGPGPATGGARDPNSETKGDNERR